MDIIVSGLHRSGTTHFANLVSISSGLNVIHEPTSYELGDIRVPCWYPEKGDFNGDFLSFMAALNDKRLIKPRYLKRIKGEAFIRTLARSIIGGTFEKSLVSRLPHYIVKDPFLIRLLQFVDIRIPAFVTYKHPLANLFSVQRQSWSIDINMFSKNIFLRHGQNKKLFEKYFNKEEVIFLLLWEYIHSELLDNFQENFQLINHEKFCLLPMEFIPAFETISEKYKLNIDMEIFREKIVKTMLRSTSSRKKGLHAMNRNSRAIAVEWKKSYNQDKIKVVDEVFSRLLSNLNSKAINH
jgi:hypothetical protein